MPDPRVEVKPYRIQINLLGAHADSEAIQAMVNAVIDEAERVGLIHDWSTSLPMHEDDVVPGSELDHLVRGVDPEDDVPLI